MSKVTEFAACGQGFTEENVEIGGRLTTKKCQDGHEGPFNRIATTTPPAGNCDYFREVLEARPDMSPGGICIDCNNTVRLHPRRPSGKCPTVI